MPANSKSPRGSEWRRWDLHVHTIASAFNHSFGDDWDVYVEKLIDAAGVHDIRAIATADYFTIDGYRHLTRYYDPTTQILSARGKSAQILLIPGVELRLNIFNSADESVNLHVFFDPEHCSPDFIDSNFLEELRVSYRDKECTLKAQNLYAIGKSIVTGTDVRLGTDFDTVSDEERKSYRRQALETISLSKKDITEALKDIDKIFQRQKLSPKAHLVAVVGKGHGEISSLEWFEKNKTFSRAGLVREDLTHQADLIFSNSQDDRAFYLGKEKATPEEEIRQRFKQPKPCIWGSDSHDFEHLLHPSNGHSADYTWLKADLSFEGFKQIVFEPDLRVRIQEDSPSEAETYARIDRCVIDLPENLTIQAKESEEAIPFCLRGKYEIEFSSNLSCVVGGRGTGKSTLVHLLYNSWTGREPDRLIELDSPLTDLKLTKDPLTRVRELVTTDIPGSTEFFLQNEIEKFAKDIQQMSVLVRHRLERMSSLEDGQKSLRELATDWNAASLKLDELISAYDRLTSAQNDIALLQGQIATLKKQTEIIKSDEYKRLQNGIEEIARATKAFETYDREHRRLAGDLAALEKSIERFNWTTFGAQEALNALKADLQRHKTALEAAHGAAKVQFDANNYPQRLAEGKQALTKYLREKGLRSENIGELTDAAQQIAALESQIQILRTDVAPAEELYAQKADILRVYESSYWAYHERFFSVSGQLQDSLAGLKFAEEETEITFHARRNEHPLKDSIVEFVKANNTSKAVLSADSIQSVLFDQKFTIDDFIADKNRIRQTISDSQRAATHTQVLQELLSSDVFLERLSLRMHKHHCDIANIQVQTKLGDKLLQSTSFGERCGIVMAIVLVAGTNPIVIDQPEDNLDGKFISTVLVPLLRKQKQSRQVILVTRDANIVIGGDSELIYVLEPIGGQTALLPSTIEDKLQRPKYIWVLDGGEKAFQTREEKYNLA